MRRVHLSLLLLVALAALLAPAAHASDSQLSVMQDDDLLLYSDPAVRLDALQQMQRLGADAVRVTVLWRVLAEGAQPGPGFNGEDPSTYPVENWDRLDGLVLDAQRVGLAVYFSVTGPGPRWGHRTAPPSARRDQGTWKPKASLYGQFVTAVGKRYGGTYADENSTRQTLPRVTMWSLWNEPNQAGWLTPQWQRKGKRKIPTPASPGLYRSLHRAGYDALAATGHGTDIILIGETAPLGTSRRNSRASMRPGKFLRELMCITPQGRRYRAASAARRGCAAVSRGPLRATGFAHHPYTKKLSPNIRPEHPDDITMGNIGRLGGLLDRLARATRALPLGMEIFLTEYGYESRPPDPHGGISLATQASWMQIGELQAYDSKRIRSQSQFLLRDSGPRRNHTAGTKAFWSTYQSGLYFLDGRAKPAVSAYQLPFVAFRAGRRGLGFWGQLRFRPNGAADVAQVQWRPRASAPWQNVGPPTRTNDQGYFETDAPRPGPGGAYRAIWTAPGGEVSASLATVVLRRRP